MINEKTIEGEIFLKQLREKKIGKTRLVFAEQKGIVEIEISINSEQITLKKINPSI